MKAIFFYILILINTFAIAQDAQLVATASKSKVGTGERFEITYSINKEATDFRPPSLSGFKVVGGPNQSTSMQWVNGQTTFSQSFSLVIIAPDEGTFTISPATVRVNGKLVQSNTLIIHVVKGANPPPSSQQQQPSQRPNQPNTSPQDIGNNLYLKVSVDKTKAYIGEQIMATYKIYTRVNIVNNGVNKLPSLNGFWSQDIENKGPAELYTEVVDGVPYNVADLKRTILFPQRTGTLEIDPLALDVVVRLKSASRGQSIFDQFFGTYEDVSYTIKSKPVKVEVLSLPEKDKPANHTGAVGNFTIAGKLDKTKVKANEAINYKITISGKGNLKLLDIPKIEIPPDIESYDPKITDKITTNQSGVSGSRTFELLLIPRHSGTFTIPAVNFSYFNPEEKTYKTLSIEEQIITVEKGAPGSESSHTPAKEDIKMLNSDIRYIKTSTELRSPSEFFFGSWLFYLFLLFPVGLFILFVLWWRKNREMEADVVGTRSRKANKMAAARLSVAKKHLDSNNQKMFYEEVFKALYGYLSDRLNIPQSGLYKEIIKEKLQERKVTDDTIATLFTTIDHCEFARFAPSSATSGQQVYDDAAAVISKIEEEIK